MPVVLHLSDFHFTPSAKYDREIIKSSLFDHIKARRGDGVDPDAIFVTGDVANSGQPEEYAQASTYFDALLECSGLDRSRLFVVPGNHDIDRTRLPGLGRTLDSLQASDSLFRSGNPIPQITIAQRGFADWYDSYFAGIHSFSLDSSCSSPRILEVGEIKLGIGLINSAIFSQDNDDNGKLWLGRRCLSRLRDEIAALGVSHEIILVHHPLDWLSEVERSSIKALLQENFDILCHGHLHETDYSNVAGPHGSILTITAGAAYQDAPWPKRAHWLQFDDSSVTICPIRFEETPKPVWTTDPSLFPNDDRHCRKIVISQPTGAIVRSPSEAELDKAAVEQADPDLFVAPDGSIIDVLPRICDAPQTSITIDTPVPPCWTPTQIAASQQSFAIHCPLEHGGTYLARAISRQIKLTGGNLRLETATALPNYEKRLREYFDKPDVLQGATLIIDNFVPGRDNRLIKEIQKLGYFGRFIVLAKTSPISSASEIVPHLPDGFLQLYLWGWDRARIRGVAEQIFNTSSVDQISSAVDKTYSDLLGLAIPLTPANVVMYLHILWRERDFQPLDRVNILERYIREVLSAPSDAFAGAFNVKNKLSLAAGFVKHLFDTNRSGFTIKDWNDFCRSYAERTLISFDAGSVLLAFETARLFVRLGSHYHLRYSFLYSYLVGFAVANRSRELDDFLKKDKHFRLGSVVETISALSTDNTFLLEVLVEQLDGYVAQFRREYIPERFDPLANAQWPDSNEEAEEVWGQVAKEIAEGPEETEKLDEIKTSLVAESRSLNQEVVLRQFSEMEKRLFASISLVEEAIKNSDEVDGAIKTRAYRSLTGAYLIVLQIATILAKHLATKRFFRWGGLAFINEAPDRLEEVESGNLSPLWVIPAVNLSIMSAAAEKLGSRKLGSLFVSTASDRSMSEFEQVISVSLIVRTKPHGWSDVVEKAIKAIDRRQYRLWLLLRMLRTEYREELNQQVDRDEIKRLIALIEAKRTTKSNSPGNRAVGQMLTVLEEHKFFEKITEATEKASEAAVPMLQGSDSLVDVAKSGGVLPGFS